MTLPTDQDLDPGNIPCRVRRGADNAARRLLPRADWGPAVRPAAARRRRSRLAADHRVTGAE